MSSENAEYQDATTVETPPEPAENTLASSSGQVAWYARISEDWWATIVGLLLVILIVSRLITSIP